jgi:ribosomal protein L17
VKGHSGNPSGRPIDQFKYQKKIDTATTLKDWRAIIDKAIEQAKRGDAKARQWLSEYLAGKPIQGLDVNSTGEMEIIVRYENTDNTADPTREPAEDQE